MINIKDLRCPECNQLLIKVDYVVGEIKCQRCKKIIKLDITKDRA
ncbi:Com family DNA-binding transcriptional regulator [Paraclostridium bifermentans]|nr:Com family DNA-binding transcriptional regulator [Paraclostridium bifermentans]